jgi:hypothetical protein
MMPANIRDAEAIMCSKFTVLLSALAFAALSGACVADPSPASDPLGKLGMWVGHWAFSGRIYQTPYSEAHADAGVGDCTLTAHRAYLTCDYFSQDPPHDDLSVMTYSRTAKAYTLVVVHQDRPPTSEKNVTQNGNTWISSRDVSYQGKTLVIRTIFVFLTPDKQTTTVQVSADKGQTWTTMIAVTSVKAA